MARATSLEKAGLVVGLCPDTDAYERLAIIARKRHLGCEAVRAAGTCTTVRSVRAHAAAHDEFDLDPWVERLQHIDRLAENDVLDAFADEPLLNACFTCLAKIPAGGAPWQGSWRGNALHDVLKGIKDGGILLVVEAHSLDEQRDWARTLLKSGCAFVQTHDDAVSAL